MKRNLEAVKRAAVKVDARGATLRSDVPIVQVRNDEYLTNDEAVVALAQHAAAAAARNDRTAIFQRDAELVRVLRLDSDETHDGIKRSAGSARIASLPFATLRETLTRAASFRKITSNNENTPTPPPKWCVEALAARGHWDGIPRLAGIVTFPVLRADGTLLQKPGYDPASGLLYIPTGVVADVPDAPTCEDAERAVGAILTVLEDFPFAKDAAAPLAHHAAVIAALLTPLARPAFRSSAAPMFVIEATMRGSGKTLLADLIGLIVTGSDFARMRFPGIHNDDELRKMVTSVVLNGDRLCLLDNVTGTLGGATLDTLLTATEWRDRLLKTMKMVSGPLNAVWFATSNNAALGGDTARRVLPIRLESEHERPEERADFKIPDIRSHVRQARPQLLAAALTILRAYFVAGCPKQTFTPWGSYEDFDRVVRSAVMFAGLPDPCLTRAGLTVCNTTEDEGVRDLVHGLHALIRVHPMATTRKDRAILAGEIAKALNAADQADDHATLRNGFDALRGDRAARGNPSPQEIGHLLRRYRGRWVDGFQIQTGPVVHNTQSWTVAGRKPE